MQRFFNLFVDRSPGSVARVERKWILIRPHWLPIRVPISPRNDLIIGLLGIATLILLWCVLSYGGLIAPTFLPKPTDLLWGTIEFHQQGRLLPAIWGSTWEVGASLVIVILVGLPIGVLMGAFAHVDAFLRKIINGAKSVPTTGLTGLVVLWFGVSVNAKVAFLFLGAILYMIILVKNAVAAVNEDYMRVGLDLGASRWQIITRVLLPGALPQIWEAVAVCNGIMWTYIVLAESINFSEEQMGLGNLLNIGFRTREPGKVFAMLIIIAIISSFTDFILQSVRKKWLNW
jgi:ABC-type nitrate/sulfonate/bicarbonate transport system permease component